MSARYWVTETISDNREWRTGDGPVITEPSSEDGSTWELVGPATACAFIDRDGDHMTRYVFTWREVTA